MGDFTETHLWQSTLADRGSGDSLAEPRELLRSTYMRMRKRVRELAGEIAQDFPELTDHGITHLDALWEIGDMIAGPDYELNPAEAFVFGGGVLLHDLGLGAAAYPGGRSELEDGDEWADAVSLVLGEELGRPPGSAEIADASADIKATALKAVLRKRHAEQAEQLGLISWKGKSEERLFLLDNSELRSAYGRIIGRVGRSHWQSVGDLSREFPTDLTAPGSLPSEWTVDQVSVACLLRTADASHLDQRRAPELVGAVRPIGPESEVHWAAQRKIHQPRAKGDRLEYTSGEPFEREESQAWWFCLSLLKNADREMREVDALLEDTNKSRFQIRGVRGVDDPLRMATYIRTEGWLPVDAMIHISDVNRIVEHLGGEQLYGSRASVGLRELIQNATDAIRARRELEDLPADWGKVTIEIGQDEQGDWLEVRDEGVGMSPRVLTGGLLDFGQSLWRSPEVAREFPGLAGKGFQSVGRFGIGFFSVFMLGERTSVVSRRYDRGYDETHVLEFPAGIEERPLMRKAESSERLHRGGTKVRVWLRHAPREGDGLLTRWGDQPPMSLEALCLDLAPALPVDMEVVEDGRSTLALRADDWRSIDAEMLLKRLAASEHEPDDERIKLLAANLRSLILADGTVVGRACITPRFSGEGIGSGTIAVGGLRATDLAALNGILEGEALVAARDEARPLVPGEVLADWASEQGRLGDPLGSEDDLHFDLADIVGRCGGDTGDCPIVACSEGSLSFAEAVKWIRGRDEIRSASWFEVNRGEDGLVELNENILISDNGYMSIVATPRGPGEWPGELFPDRVAYNLVRCDWKLAKACCSAWECGPDEIEIDLERGEIGSYRGGPVTGRVLRIRRTPPPATAEQ